MGPPPMRLALLVAAGLAAVGSSLGGCSDSDGEAAAPRERWSEGQAAAWYAEQPWIVGANFVPSTAVNQLEMWQAATYDEATIDRELGWAADLGFNGMRVFLHDLVWAEDPEGFLARIDRFLDVADRHGMRILFVFFDGVWNPFPVAGPQPAPIAHVHNSQWVQSPGAEILADFERHDELEPYVTGVIERFRTDRRVLAWDLFNEPDNPNVISYREVELAPELKEPAAEALLQKAFVWARSVGPTQPLTAGLWQGEWDDPAALSRLNRLMIEQSDVLSFHSYANPDEVADRVAALQQYGRPLLCTEYLARSGGNTFQSILPIFDQQEVGAFHWGLVSGKTQTIYSWLSWASPDPAFADPWFHDVFYPDGTPYDPAETKLIRALTDR